MPPPANPKIYHIVHADRLASIIAKAGLWCDAVMSQQTNAGTMIGITNIKQRRLNSPLMSRKGLKVGDCVPFYFCPRSVMLYLIHRANDPNLPYKGGQAPILHLECDLNATVAWANKQPKRWAFTLSNAGSNYFEDRADLAKLHEIDWAAVAATQWQKCREGKQAEFLIEEHLPWHLVDRIGVISQPMATQVIQALQQCPHKPSVQVLPNWYY